MEGENLIEDRGILAAPLTFFVVVVFQLLSKWLDQWKKVIKIKPFGFFPTIPSELIKFKFPLFFLLKFVQKGSKNTREAELRSEIKQLLREASAMSQ